MLSAGLLHLMARAALAAALQADPTPTTSEATCALYWEPETDGWYECTVALESWRCDVQGWCSGDIVEGPESLPDPSRPGQSYVTLRHRAPETECDQW